MMIVMIMMDDGHDNDDDFDEIEQEITWRQWLMSATMEVSDAKKDKPGFDIYDDTGDFRCVASYLNPKVNGAQSKTQWCSEEMDCRHWGLLQVEKPIMWVGSGSPKLLEITGFMAYLTIILG